MGILQDFANAQTVNEALKKGTQGYDKAVKNETDILSVERCLKNLYFDTVTEMTTCTTLNDGDYVRTGGYYSVGDGGGALYRISTTKPSSYYEEIELSGTIVAYAQLIENDVINVLHYGAKRTTADEFDNTDAFTNAIRAGIEKEVYVPAGIYYFANNLIIDRARRRIRGETDGTYDALGSQLKFAPDCGVASVSRYAVISNLNIAPFNTQERSTASGIKILAAHCEINDCIIQHFTNGIAYIKDSWVNYVNGCRLLHNTVGIKLNDQCNAIFINKCYLQSNDKGIWGDSPTRYGGNVGVHVENCTFQDNKDIQIHITASTSVWFITNCYLEHRTGVGIYCDSAFEENGTGSIKIGFCRFYLYTSNVEGVDDALTAIYIEKNDYASVESCHFGCSSENTNIKEYIMCGGSAKNILTFGNTITGETETNGVIPLSTYRKVATTVYASPDRSLKMFDGTDYSTIYALSHSEKTDTTNEKGVMQIPLNSEKSVVVSAYVTMPLGRYIAVPYQYNSGWYLSVFSAEDKSAIADTEITVKFAYFDISI